MTGLDATRRQANRAIELTYWVVLGALVIRLVVVVWANQGSRGWHLVPTDTRATYQPLAASLVERQAYELGGDAREASRVAPLFPIYLASLQSLMNEPPPTWLLGEFNALIRSGTTLVVFLLGRSLSSPRVGAFAALLHALDPWEAFWTPFVVKEAIAVLLFTFAVLQLFEAAKRPSLQRGLFAGAAIGLASLARFASIGLLLCAALLLFPWAGLRGERRRGALLASGFGVALATFLALMPWLVRNRMLFGEWLLTSHPVGRYLYVASADVASPDAAGYVPTVIADPQPLKEVERPGVTPSEAARKLFLATLERARKDPMSVLDRWLGRVVGMWRPTYEGSSWSNLLLLGGPYALQMALAALGFVAALRARQHLAALGWILAVFVALHTVLFADIRFRQYLMPLLHTLGGYFIASLRCPPRDESSGHRP